MFTKFPGNYDDRMPFGNGDFDNCPPGQYPHPGAHNEYASHQNIENEKECIV